METIPFGIPEEFDLFFNIRFIVATEFIRWPKRFQILYTIIMFGLGTAEIILVLALALIFIGPEKLPQIATALGKIVRQIRRAVDEIKDDLKNE